jgi:hypothetical protein
MDLDSGPAPKLAPGPAIFVTDLQDANKKLPVFFSKFFYLLIYEGTFTSFFKTKSHKEITKQ